MMKEAAYIIKNLALELGCTPFEIIDNLVGMVISEEQESELKELL